MWKYVSRRLKDTLERSCSYFDAKNVKDSASLHCKIVSNVKPLSVYTGRSNSCWSTFFSDGKNNKTNNKKWYYEQINSTWIGAITWSSALIIGWYASQLICFSNRKYRKCPQNFTNPAITKIHPLLPLRCVHTQPIIPQEFHYTPEVSATHHVTYVSNDNTSSGASSGSSSVSRESIDGAVDKLTDVLSAIENKLGLAAMENGDPNEGLSMLKSAALRNHAPALFNLGLCYENGLGTAINEKMAMEYYRAAASLEHSTAMYNLAVFYGQGRGGLTKDRDMALRLLRIAASKGQEEAITALKCMRPQEPEQYTSGKFVDSPTTLFLKMVGALNPNELQVSRAEELIY